MLLRCHMFDARLSVTPTAEDWAAMRRTADGGSEKFGKLLAAVRDACNGWMKELFVTRPEGKIEVVIAAPKHIDLDKFVDEFRLRVGLAMYACGIRERDPGHESALEALLERTAQPKEPTVQAAESAPASA